MTPQDLATEAERRKATEAALRRASERAQKSPDGLRDTARDLRHGASSMANGCDRDTMLRLAAEYERRADDSGRPKRPLRAAPFAAERLKTRDETAR